MKGWRDLSGADLDAAYANAAHIEGGAEYPARWLARAAAFRATARADLDVAYAEVEGAALDLFHPDGDPRGLVAFVHGGYWRAFGKAHWSHLAAGALARGHAVAVIGYPLAPRVRISGITGLIARAVERAAERVAGPVRLSGHSAGGHLAARMVMADAAPSCRDRIAACVPVSPLADLRPLLGHPMNADLRLDPAEALAESPSRGAPLPGPKIAVHVGAAERPAFLWQAEELAAAWSVPLRIVPGRHHFDILDALTDPKSALMDDLLA